LGTNSGNESKKQKNNFCEDMLFSKCEQLVMSRVELCDAEDGEVVPVIERNGRDRVANPGQTNNMLKCKPLS